MPVLLPILYALLFIFLIYKINFFTLPSISRNAIAAVFIFKIIAGTFLWWLYTYHYPGADLLDYFNDGKTLFNVLLRDPGLFFQIVFQGASFPKLHSWNDSFEHILYNDAHTMIVLNTLLHFFSLGHFHVHTVFMCFLSIIGLTALFRSFLPFFENGKKILFAAVFLIPSVLFWSSGVLKEGLLFFGMGMFLYATNCGFRTTYHLKQLVVILVSITLLLLVKFYVLIALLPGLLLNMWISKTSAKFIFIKYAAVIFICCFGIIFVSNINNDYNPLKIIADKQAKAISEAKGGVFLYNEVHFVCIDYKSKADLLNPINDSVYTINKGSSYLQWDLDNMNDTTFIVNSIDTARYTFLYEVAPANTTLDLKRLQPSFFSLLMNAPNAFFNVLVQPWIWNSKGVMQLLPALENIFFIGLLLLTLIFFKRKIENRSMIIFCLSFVVILYVLIGLTTPAVGAIIRYKVPALPFLFIVLLLLMDRKKIAEKFPFIEKWLQ
ncbi:MAG: hypothetical protein ACT4ON_01415 [Bacteroidota bacterium]